MTQNRLIPYIFSEKWVFIPIEHGGNTPYVGLLTQQKMGSENGGINRLKLTPCHARMDVDAKISDIHRKKPSQAPLQEIQHGNRYRRHPDHYRPHRITLCGASYGHDRPLQSAPYLLPCGHRKNGKLITPDFDAVVSETSNRQWLSIAQ
jgi:hypothetical protein